MKKTPFYGKIIKGIWQFTQEKIFRAFCQIQKDGDYVLELSKVKCPKTNEQLGYFHGVVVPVVFRQMIDDGNDNILICIKSKVEGEPHKYKEIKMTEEVVVNMLKEIWAKHTGNEVKSKAEMNIEEASELIDVSIMWAERYLGCHIPPPEKTL